MTAVKINNLEYQARCLMKTKIRLDQRSFSDFTIDELNDYAGCIYDLGKMFHIDFEKFYLNRLTKEFSYDPKNTIMKQLSTNGYFFTKEMCVDVIRWERISSFLEYLFNVRGTKKFEYLVRAGKTRLSNNEKKELNNFAKQFCDCAFYDLWGLFNKHKIVKQKVLDYFCDIGILNKHEHGYARNPKCDYGIGYKI